MSSPIVHELVAVTRQRRPFRAKLVTQHCRKRVIQICRCIPATHISQKSEFYLLCNRKQNTSANQNISPVLRNVEGPAGWRWIQIELLAQVPEANSDIRISLQFLVIDEAVTKFRCPHELTHSHVSRSHTDLI